MSYLVLQHSEANRPGRLGLTLRDRGHRLDVRRLHRNDEVPADLDDLDGIISLGGPQNVGDSAPWMGRECALLKAAHDADLPVLGICLGAQLIAHALGGAVAPMPAPEVGMHRIELNPAGQIDTLLSGIAWSSFQFCHHGQEVTKLPPGGATLASSAMCKVQAFRVARSTYGFQYHFECDRPMIADLVRSHPRTLQAAGITEVELNKAVEQHYQSFARLADRLCVNIASYLMPLTHRATA